MDDEGVEEDALALLASVTSSVIPAVAALVIDANFVTLDLVEELLSLPPSEFPSQAWIPYEAVGDASVSSSDLFHKLGHKSSA